MKIKLQFVLMLLAFTNPFALLSQVNWKTADLTIKGNVLNIENQEEQQITFYFKDIITNDLQSTYFTDIDSDGNFKISVPIFYPQDFYMKYGRLIRLLGSPGDTVILEIDADIQNDPENLKPNGQHFVRVVSGNRIKDNEDIIAFIDKLPNDSFIYEHYEQALEYKKPSEFKSYIYDRQKVYTEYFNRFNDNNNTTDQFNKWAEDFIKYNSLACLLEYVNQKAMKRISFDSIHLTDEYFEFMKLYDMEDYELISMEHADFLHEYTMFLLSYPSDSVSKAKTYFGNNEIVPGAKVLLNILFQQTKGFTQNLLLTKFFLNAIKGQQIHEFEQLYNSNYITDPFFTERIRTDYSNLKRYMANTKTDGANLRSITGHSVKTLLDSISVMYSNKVIYIDFWAPWCSPCMAELPYSQELQEYYKNDDVVFLFLGNQCKEDSWKATIANKGLTGQHILLSDSQFSVFSSEWKFLGIPHYVLINKKGDVVHMNAARPSDKELIIQQINSLLVSQ